MPCYSQFWLSGGVLTRSLWAAKDAQSTPATPATPYDGMSLNTWANMTNADHLAACRSLGFEPTPGKANLYHRDRQKRAA